MNPTILITFVLMALTLLPLQGGCAKRSNLPATETSSKPSHSTGTILQTYQYSELHSLDNFTFTERDGSDFGKTNLDGKVWIASFFFSSCKFECSDQNRTIRDEIHEKLAGLDFTVVSISCDPANDTVSVLNQYANEFTTHPDKWKFLTAPMSAIQTMADRNFKVIVEPAIHSKRLLLVDKWGRFRDSFEWKEKDDLNRLLKKARVLCAETTQPPADKAIKTRALPDSVFNGEPVTHTHSQRPTATTNQTSKTQPKWPSWRKEDWITSFELTDAQGNAFRSTSMKGKVWVANFFFTSCTGTCPKLLSKIQELRSQIADRDVTFVSISNDPDTDTPRVLKQYSQKFGADDRWYFLTGEQQLQIRAIGSEFFGVNGGVGETHSEQLTVVDKQGNIRGHFDYNQAAELTQLRLLLDDLISEKDPT